MTHSQYLFKIALCSKTVAASLATSGCRLSSTSNVRITANSPIFQIACRGYRGNAGDAVDRLSPEEEALLKIAQPKAAEIMRRHIALPDDGVETRRKRLVYRSKQRGWLEVDLLLGTWASENVPHLSSDELDQFEAFVNMETIDIYNVITLRLDVPEELKQNGRSVAERIQEWARSSPLGKADPDTYKAVKTEHKLI
jgi:succinate dehydrogenase flavin-adding protein (antitoxin of CptAB toxin-antitoxin module)